MTFQFTIDGRTFKASTLTDKNATSNYDTNLRVSENGVVVSGCTVKKSTQKNELIELATKCAKNYINQISPLINTTMESITTHRKKIRISVIDFKDVCALFGQNGIISIGIAEELSESLNNEQIDWLIYHLKRLQHENRSQPHE